MSTETGIQGASDGSDELSRWLARYEPVEREIMEANARRLENKMKRRGAAAKAFGDLCEATEGFAVVWRREGWSIWEMVRWADGDVATLLALTAWLHRDVSRYIDRVQHQLRRPFYYAREKARREALARERRRVTARHTVSPCPTREQILDAWVHRRDSHEAAVRFGSMVHDLECYVDNSLLRDAAGTIVGRRGGVKEWLRTNIPALYTRYTTVMRYKAMAKKLRQVTGLADPIPAAAVLGDTEVAAVPDTDEKQDYGTDEISWIEGHGDVKGRGNDRCMQQDRINRDKTGWRGTNVGVPTVEIVRARAVWLEVVEGVRGSATALMARLDALTDPERVEEAAMLAEWRKKYENEITVRTKSRWWGRSLRTKVTPAARVAHGNVNEGNLGQLIGKCKSDGNSQWSTIGDR